MAFVQAKQFVSVSATNGNVTPSMTLTSGNTVFVLYHHGYTGCPVTSITDSLSNTYTLNATINVAGGSTNGGAMYVFSAPVTTGGSAVITAHAGCGTTVWATALEYSGIPASPYDTSSAGLGNTNSMSGTSVTPSTNGSLILGSFTTSAGGATVAAGSGFVTEITENTQSRLHIVEDATQATAGAIQVTGTGSIVNFALFPVDIFTVVFKQSGGAGPTRNSNFLAFF